MILQIESIIFTYIIALPFHHSFVAISPFYHFAIKENIISNSITHQTTHQLSRHLLVLLYLSANNHNQGNKEESIETFHNDDASTPTTNTIISPDVNEALLKIMNISSAHFKSQALHTFVKLQIADIMKKEQMTIHEIATKLNNEVYGGGDDYAKNGTCTTGNRLHNMNINEDALLRTMRLLTTIDVVTEQQSIVQRPSDDDNDNDNDNDDEDNNKSYNNYTDKYESLFQLTSFGMLLQSKANHENDKLQENISSCVLHWMENPLYDAWKYLPDYIIGQQSTSTSYSQSEEESKKDMNIYVDTDVDTDADTDTDKSIKMQSKLNQNPFQLANNGISSDVYYNVKDHPQSLQYANDFVKLISNSEINSIVTGFDWSKLENKTMIDIGGYNGKVMDAIGKHYSHVEFDLKCLDLPDVITRIKSFERDNLNITSISSSSSECECKCECDGNVVELIEGDVMKSETIPSCDVIFMKHFLDRCMWTEEETVQILETCSNSLLDDENGMIILGEAVIPDRSSCTSTTPRNDNDNVNDKKYVDQNASSLFTFSQDEKEILFALDALYMLVGRERQRSVTEWILLANKASLQVKEIIPTLSPSCYLIVLKKMTR